MRAKRRASSRSVASCDDSLRQLLSEFRVCSETNVELLLREFCSLTRSAFAVAVASYWKLASPGEITCVACEGTLRDVLLGLTLDNGHRSTILKAATKSSSILVQSPASARDLLSVRFGMHTIAAVRVHVNGETHGVLALMHPRRFNSLGTNTEVTLQTLASLLGTRIGAAADARRATSYQKRAEGLMNLSVDSSRPLPISDFVRRFTARAADMLNARIAALGLIRGENIEGLVFHQGSGISDPVLLSQLESALTGIASQPFSEVVAGSAADVLGPSLSAALRWNDVALAPLRGSDGDLLGILCLADHERSLQTEERNLLKALASHASVTIEHFRRFSQIERSKKQWVEDIDAISDFIVVHDRTHRILRVNRSFAAYIGSQPTELVGEEMKTLAPFSGATGDGMPCPFCRGAQPSDEENIRSAKERMYLISTSRIRGASDDDFRTVHVLKDITDRREAERRYRELFDNIQEGLFFSTPDGRFLDVNDAMVRMLGYESREELLQTNITHHLYLAPERRQRLLDAIAERGVLRNYEEPLRRKDGTILHTLQNIFAVRDGQGAVTQYRGLMLDVTEQKTFQAQLQRERDFNQKILNNTQSMILVLDTAGLISYANSRCFEAGYKEAELLGHRLVEWVSPSRRQDFEAALDTTANGVQVDNLELPFRRGDGSTGHFSVSLSPIRDEQAHVNSIVVVMTDITDAAILQAKLAHSEKMATIGQLVSGVAHEINNPLAAIVGFTDLLLENPEVPQAAKDDLQVILQEAQRTKEIVHDLLSFARQSPARREPVQVNAVLRQTVKLRAYDFSSHGVEVLESFDPALPRVVGDSQQLQQVFLNILNNAYDAVRETRQRGRIEMQTSQRSGFVEVLFRDNGPGIANPDRIFDPFFTTKEVGKGTGLGLSICYGIVRAHDGEIACHNNWGATGSTFIVKLPIAAGAAAAAAGETTP